MRILLVVPSFRRTIYEGTKIRAGRIESPFLSLAVLASPLIAAGHEVRILDLDIHPDPSRALAGELASFKPAFAGLSVATPLFHEAAAISRSIRGYDPAIKIVLGGPHPTALPEESLKESSADMAVMGEGDRTLLEIAEGTDPRRILGLAYREDGGIRVNPARPFITDMDSLPFPSWQLYDLKRYDVSKVWGRESPAGWIETSRGCPFDCSYCTKAVFGRNFRPKSPRRVVDEMRHYLDAGFKELHIADDMFTADIRRVKAICDEIVSRGMRFPWAAVTGIRVDRGDAEMFEKMARAGCYRICIGVESGSQRVLDAIGKGISLGQARDTVRMAKSAGMEVFAFFMLALPGDTEESMRETIDFACGLDLDYAKAAVTTPLPGTELFARWDKEGRIRTRDWSKYNLYLPRNRIYDHPSLDWDTIEKYYDRFWRRFYLRPGFMLKTLAASLRGGKFFSFLWAFLRTRW